jgi:hypothetical protein
MYKNNEMKVLKNRVQKSGQMSELTNSLSEVNIGYYLFLSNSFRNSW